MDEGKKQGGAKVVPRGGQANGTEVCHVDALALCRVVCIQGDRQAVQGKGTLMGVCMEFQRCSTIMPNMVIVFLSSRRKLRGS